MEPNDEVISVQMTRAQALVIEAWLIGQDARMQPLGTDAAGLATYVVTGAELNLRRRRSQP